MLKFAETFQINSHLNTWCFVAKLKFNTGFGCNVAIVYCVIMITYSDVSMCPNYSCWTHYFRRDPLGSFIILFPSLFSSFRRDIWGASKYLVIFVCLLIFCVPCYLVIWYFCVLLLPCGSKLLALEGSPCQNVWPSCLANALWHLDDSVHMWSTCSIYTIRQSDWSIKNIYC